MQPIPPANSLNLLITPAKTDDAQELVGYLNKVGGESDFLSYGENEFGLSVDEEAHYIHKLSKNKGNLMLIGKIGDKIVSVLNIWAHPRGRMAHRGKLGMSVLKAYWGQGIGTQMMQAMLDWAKTSPLHKIELEVIETNSRAIALYERLGFTREGKARDAVRINDCYFDDIIMSKIMGTKES